MLTKSGIKSSFLSSAKLTTSMCRFVWAKRTYGHKSYGIGVDYDGNCYTAGSIKGGNMFFLKL